MRSGQQQAQQTFGTATGNATTAGTAAATDSSALTPFLMSRLNSPQGYSQGDLGAMIANAMGGAGGSTSGITGQAIQTQGRTRNDAGFATALTEAARDRGKTLASASEGIASNDANLKQQQQSDAARALQGLYGTNIGAQNADLNTADNATQTGIEAQKSGWLQNMNQIISTITGGKGFRP